MDASNWINLGILIVAMIAAVIAIFQVVEARKARSDAEAARDSAEKYERRTIEAAERAASSASLSADAHQRSAKALEEHTAIVRSTTSPPKPWILEPTSAASIDQTWRVTNNTGLHVPWLAINTPNGFSEQWITTAEDVLGPLEPGESTSFTFILRLGSPRTSTIWVIWPNDDGDGNQKYTEFIRAHDPA